MDMRAQMNFFCFIFQGGNATFPNILNNFVHVLMYFYYMLSAMGPQYQKYLWWKKWMTEIQIVSSFNLFSNKYFKIFLYRGIPLEF